MRNRNPDQRRGLYRRLADLIWNPDDQLDEGAR